MDGGATVPTRIWSISLHYSLAEFEHTIRPTIRTEQNMNRLFSTALVFLQSSCIYGDRPALMHRCGLLFPCFSGFRMIIIKLCCVAISVKNMTCVD